VPTHKKILDNVGQTILLNAKHKDTVQSYKNLNDSQYTVISKLGTMGEEAVQAMIPNAVYKTAGTAGDNGVASCGFFSDNSPVASPSPQDIFHRCFLECAGYLSVVLKDQSLFKAVICNGFCFLGRRRPHIFLSVLSVYL
jgi:hypothetical protein